MDQVCPCLVIESFIVAVNVRRLAGQICFINSGDFLEFLIFCRFRQYIIALGAVISVFLCKKQRWSSDNGIKVVHTNRKDRYMTDWQQILDDNAHSLWQVVYQLLSNSHEASECFKEAFISIYEESTQKPIRDNNIYPNIAKAAISKALDKLHQHFQSKSARQDATDMVIIPTNGPKPLAKIESQELAGRLRKALSQVPAQKAQIFCLAKFVELSNKQIAKTYDLNKKAVAVLIHQTKEKLACFLELRGEQRVLGENKNIIDDAVAAIKQESVSTNPPGKTLHDITKILPAPAEPQLSEAMQKKSKIVRRIKALNRFKIITAVAVLGGAIITAKLFTFIQQKQLEKADQNSNLVVTKPAGLKSDIDKADDIGSLGDSAEIEFAKVMESFTTGDANGITRLFEGDSLLNRIILAKFLGEMGDEKSIQTLELFYNDTRDQLRGKIEPNPFLDAIEKIQARLGYEEVKVVEPTNKERPTTARNRNKTVEPEKQQDITGDVVSIEGYAVENADVVLYDAASPAMIVNGQVADGSGLGITTTNSQGRFTFTEIKDDSLITVIHELGFAQISKQALQQDPTIVLTGWGYVTGQLLIENAPASNQAIELTYLTGEDDKISYSHSIVTNSQGYFAFEKVKPEKVKITHIFELATPAGYDLDEPLVGNGAFKIVNLDSEKEADVVIGEDGFTITGQLELAEDVDWAHSIAEVVGSDRANPYSVLVNDDGALWCDSMPAGSYNFSVTLFTNEDGSYFQKSIAEFQTSFNLPPGDPNETTLDLGTFELNPTQE